MKILYCFLTLGSLPKDNDASSHKGISDINSTFDKLNKTLKNLGK
ncbi:hypothetical protein [Chryseobacterium sp. MEBOG06]|nr:hypothetical protein [Chryseobacterium sp. MEBOG06]